MCTNETQVKPASQGSKLAPDDLKKGMNITIHSYKDVDTSVNFVPLGLGVAYKILEVQLPYLALYPYIVDKNELTRPFILDIRTVHLMRVSLRYARLQIPKTRRLDLR